MYPTAGQPTIETIIVSSALVAVMAALRKKGFGPLHGYVLGFALWAAVISVAWGTAKGLGLSQVHFWRMYLEAPQAFAALFLCTWTFWGRRLWFLKGMALFCGTLGVLIGLDELLNFDTNRLRSFALTAFVFAALCGALSVRRRDGAGAVSAGISATRG